MDQTEPDFEAKLKEVVKATGATVALDCIAGDMTGILVNSLCRDGTVILFGNLSETHCKGLSPIALMGGNKKVEPFFLPFWMKEKSNWTLYWAMKESTKLIEETKIHKIVGLHEIREVLDEYLQDMSKGKIILKPSLSQ